MTDQRKAGRARPLDLLRVHWPELATVAAAVAGWVLVTWGLAELTTAWLWPISLGVLLLGLAGWQFVFTMLREGLYVLGQQARRNREGGAD